jgi:hypothetical protein
VKLPLRQFTWHERTIMDANGAPIARAATTQLRDAIIEKINSSQVIGNHCGARIDLTPAMIGCLSLSTSHIPERTAKELEYGAVHKTELWDLLSYQPWHDYGWVIWCSTDHGNAASCAGHTELAQLIFMCAEQNICFLQLDSDGTQIEGLPVFTW